MAKPRAFGLLGKEIDYSFSRAYFAEKFQKEGYANCSYKNFDLEHARLIEALLEETEFAGLNVTIPYKQEVIPFMDHLDPVAKSIGAVNTIIRKNNGLWGYNTDAVGFEKALKESWQSPHQKALILGTGGASKAIAYVLRKNEIEFHWVSRKASGQTLSYADISPEVLQEHTLIINCTPLGTFPQTDLCPELPYSVLSAAHHLFDLVYNPEVTTFMKHGLEKGATVSNGYQMLVYQAEASWEIWNE